MERKSIMVEYFLRSSWRFKNDDRLWRFRRGSKQSKSTAVWEGNSCTELTSCALFLLCVLPQLNWKPILFNSPGKTLLYCCMGAGWAGVSYEKDGKKNKFHWVCFCVVIIIIAGKWTQHKGAANDIIMWIKQSSHYTGGATLVDRRRQLCRKISRESWVLSTKSKPLQWTYNSKCRSLSADIALSA